MKISCPKCQQHYEIGSPGDYRCTRCGSELKISEEVFNHPGKVVAERSQGPTGVGKPLEYYVLKCGGLLLAAIGILVCLGALNAGGVALAFLPLGLVCAVMLGSLLCAAATALNYLREIRNHIVNK